MFDACNRVDWNLLYWQKDAVLDWLITNPHAETEFVESLWGVVHLVEALQDDAVAAGRWQVPDDHVPSADTCVRRLDRALCDIERVREAFLALSVPGKLTKPAHGFPEQ